MLFLCDLCSCVHTTVLELYEELRHKVTNRKQSWEEFQDRSVGIDVLWQLVWDDCNICNKMEGFSSDACGVRKNSPKGETLDRFFEIFLTSFFFIYILGFVVFEGF